MPEIKIHDSKSKIWDDFAEEVEGNENNEFDMGFNRPGQLSKDLAKLCLRDGTMDLDAERVMFLAEECNYFLELIENGARIGFGLIHLPSYGEEAKIQLGCVSVTEKGKNYSKLLIDEAKRIAKAAGKKRLLLEAFNRVLGEKVYKKQGFEFVNASGTNMIHQLGGKRKGKTRKMKRKA
jgi:hypothetical protein